MYEKKFNNYSYVGCGECGITGKKKSAQTLYRNQDLKTYLTKYQWAYRNGYFLPSLPENLREIFYELSAMFLKRFRFLSESFNRLNLKRISAFFLL